MSTQKTEDALTTIIANPAPNHPPTTKPDGGNMASQEVSGTAKEQSSAMSPDAPKATNPSESSKSVATASSSEPPRLSGAELKKRKQADKAARRAEAKGLKAENAGPPIRPSQPAGPPVKTPKPAATSQQQQLRPTALQPSSRPGTGPNKLPIRGAATPAARKTLPTCQPFLHFTPLSPTATRHSSRKHGAATVALSHPRHEDWQDHLYDRPRWQPSSEITKDIHPAIRALGVQIRGGAICGSTARCTTTMLALKRVIQSYRTPPGNSLPRHLPAHLSQQVDHLDACRPQSVSMDNAVKWLKIRINDVDVGTPEDQAITALCHAIDTFVREKIIAAGQLIAGTAAEHIRPGDVVVVYAKSYVVQQTLLEAHGRGIEFQVIVLDSAPLFEGRNLATCLAAAGLSVRYAASVSASASTMAALQDATKILLGAHAVLGDGSLYSRLGSASIALAASTARVPVLVCCESIKLTDKLALDASTNELANPDELLDLNPALNPLRSSPNFSILNLRYDLVPSAYLDLIISESGPFPPAAATTVHLLNNTES